MKPHPTTAPIPLEDSVALRRPSLADLPRYVAALEAGWSPDNVRGRIAAEEQLAEIARDAPAFVAGREDREARLPPVRQPDGSLAARLPGFARWIWDDDFCGSISLRWAPGSAALPPHVLGHIGYAVVPWKRGKGAATRGLALILPEAWALGLAHVDLTTDPENLASQKVILGNGGELVERFRKPAALGGAPTLRFRIRRPEGP